MKVNGEQVPLTGPMSLADYLAGRGMDAARVAVERNGEIVPRAAFADTQLDDADVLEVVSFVGGG